MQVSDHSSPRLRVLVVEDDLDLLAVLEELLAREYYDVTPCANSREAIQAIDSNPDSWRAVITDQGLPGSSGVELVKKIHQRMPGLPCLLCSGYGDLIDETDALEAGVAAILSKPLKISQLLDWLAQVTC